MTDALLAVGSDAPRFHATANDRHVYSLDELLTRGGVALFFYPGNDTPGRNRQLSAVRDEMTRFEEARIQPLGINPASIDAHARYAIKMRFGFPLLSDADRRIARAYGALKADGVSIQRTVYVVWRDGRVAFAARGAPPVADIVAVAPA